LEAERAAGFRDAEVGAGFCPNFRHRFFGAVQTLEQGAGIGVRRFPDALCGKVFHHRSGEKHVEPPAYLDAP
jgi:hypothetical protein